MSNVAKWITFGVLAAGYILRKYRVHQFGWVHSSTTLKGKIFVITGANTGLGLETAKALARREATVILACRSEQKANEAIEKIRNVTQAGELIFLHLDLSSFKSVRSFAAILLQQFPKIECLILNAGLATNDERYTDEGYEINFGVNHLGHFLLFDRLKECLRKNNSRIVVVASQAHISGTVDFDNLGKYVQTPGIFSKLYSNSKLANFYFARELFKQKYDVHILCPGLCSTEVFRDMNLRWYHYLFVSPILLVLLKTAEQGAQTIIHCALDAYNTVEKNPATGYITVNLKQSKSPVEFSEDVSKKLWQRSLELISV